MSRIVTVFGFVFCRYRVANLRRDIGQLGVEPIRAQRHGKVAIAADHGHEPRRYEGAEHERKQQRQQQQVAHAAMLESCNGHGLTIAQRLALR